MVGVYIIFLYTPTHGQEIVKGCENIFWVLVQPILTAFFLVFIGFCVSTLEMGCQKYALLLFLAQWPAGRSKSIYIYSAKS